MKLSTVYNFLKDGELYLDILYESREEVSEYTRRNHVTGSSMPVRLIEDISAFTIGQSELKVLCNSFLMNQLTENHINYIVDILQLSHKVTFENEDIEDDFLSLTDPEINGELTKDKVMDILIRNT